MAEYVRIFSVFAYDGVTPNESGENRFVSACFYCLSIEQDFHRFIEKTCAGYSLNTVKIFSTEKLCLQPMHYL